MLRMFTTGSVRRGFFYNRTSYHVYTTRGGVALSQLQLRFIFKPQSGKGILLYASQYQNGTGHFILAQLQSSQFSFTFDTSRDTVTLRCDTVLYDVVVNT